MIIYLFWHRAVQEDPNAVTVIPSRCQCSLNESADQGRPGKVTVMVYRFLNYGLFRVSSAFSDHVKGGTRPPPPPLNSPHTAIL